VTQNLNGAPVDRAILVLDSEAVAMVAKDMGPGHTVVTCLCDSGQRYYARLFNREWLKSKDLLDSVPEKYRDSLHC
jgi:cysteine synthase A